MWILEYPTAHTFSHYEYKQMRQGKRVRGVPPRVWMKKVIGPLLPSNVSYVRYTRRHPILVQNPRGVSYHVWNGGLNPRRRSIAHVDHWCSHSRSRRDSVLKSPVTSSWTAYTLSGLAAAESVRYVPPHYSALTGVRDNSTLNCNSIRRTLSPMLI